MTIEYRGGAVMTPRTLIIKEVVENSCYGIHEHKKVKTKVELIPGKTSNKDIVTFPNSNHTVKGAAIKTDERCKKLGIGWFAQEK